MLIRADKVAMHRVTSFAKRKGFLWISIILITVPLFVIFLIANASRLGLEEHVFGRGFEVAVAMLGICLVLVFIWWRHREGIFDLFEFPVWISINIYVQVVLNVWLLQRDRVPLVPWLRVNYESQMILAVLLFAVGLLALWVGYVWVFPLFGRKSKVTHFWEREVRVRSAFAGGIGYLPAYSNLFDTWLNYIHLLNLIQLTAGTALVIHYLRRPTRFGNLWLVFMLGSNLASTLVLGTKGFALTLVWFVMCIYYGTGKFPVRWVIVGILVLIIFVPIVNMYRTNLHDLDLGSGVPISRRVGTLGEIFRGLPEVSLGSFLEGTRNTFEKRQGSLLEITASTMVLHPSTIPFLGSDVLKYFFAQLIPRVLWPDKPTERSPLFMITTNYYGAADEYGFSSIGLFADSYRTGGWAFLIIWFAFCGVFSAWLYRVGPKSGDTPKIIFYIVVLQGVLPYDTEVTTVLLRLAHFIPFIFLLVKFVLFKPPKHY
jgi:hypothetical protein